MKDWVMTINVKGRKHVFPLVVGGIFCYYIISFLIPGYCRSDHKFLSDEDMIAVAVYEAAGSGMMRIDGSEKSVWGFHRNNPNCCRVNREAGSIVHKVCELSLVDVEVDLYYKVSDAWLAKYPGEPEYYEHHALIDACGKVLRTYGAGIEKKDLPVGVD
jgi:hypothetical protein